jgi:hypothetical protein
MLKPNLAHTFSRIKAHNALAVPIILYGSDTLNLSKKDKKRLTSIDMKIFTGTNGYTIFDHKMDEEILELLKVVPFDEKIRRYKSDWLRHIKIMNSNRMSNIMLNY